MVYVCSVFCAVWLGGYCSWPLLSLCPWCAPLVLFGVYDERRIPGTHKTVIEPEQCSTSYGAREMQCSRRHRGGTHRECYAYRLPSVRATAYVIRRRRDRTVYSLTVLQYYSNRTQRRTYIYMYIYSQILHICYVLYTAIEPKGVHLYYILFIKYCNRTQRSVRSKAQKALSSLTGTPYCTLMRDGTT